MAKESLKQKAYNSIKNKILTCEYMPNSFLNEDLLCEELNVSRTPIRDALSRLEQENLIKIVPKKGFFVTPLSISDINMSFETRLLLEPYIILNYCTHLSPIILDTLYENIKMSKEAIKGGNHDEVLKLDDEFHRILLSQCTNKYFMDAYESAHNQNFRLRVLSGRYDDKRLQETIDEHMEILNYVAVGSLQEASESIKSHLANAKNSAFSNFIKGNPLL